MYNTNINNGIFKNLELEYIAKQIIKNIHIAYETYLNFNSILKNLNK